MGAQMDAGLPKRRGNGGLFYHSKHILSHGVRRGRGGRSKKMFNPRTCFWESGGGGEGGWEEGEVHVAFFEVSFCAVWLWPRASLEIGKGEVAAWFLVVTCRLDFFCLGAFASSFYLR